MNRKKPVHRRPIGLGSDAIRSRLATTRPENRNDIGHIWREQNRLARERWKLESENPGVFEQLTKRLKQKTPVYLESMKRFVHKLFRLVTKKKKLISGISIAAVLLGIAFTAFSDTSRQEVTVTTASLGANTTTSETDDRRTDEAPDFKVLYPKDRQDMTAVTRRAPSGDLIHTYKDSLEDVEIEVTQQKIPDSFKGSEQTELEKLAKNFLASNVIQVDQTVVYHGRDDKTDVQSLFLMKDESLISIRSAKPLSDDLWVAYILSLQ